MVPFRRSLFLLTGILAFVPSVTYAVPAKPGLVKVAQPDGTELLIRKTGDERHHCILSEDGYYLAETDDGRYVYLTVDSEGAPVPSGIEVTPATSRGDAERNFLSTLDTKALREAIVLTERQAITAPGRKIRGNDMRRSTGLFTDPMPFVSQGEPKGLAVTVQFPDVKFTVEDPNAHFDALLNQEGYSAYGATGSARDWFIDNSNGAFCPTFDVFGPITLPEEMSYYGANDVWGDDVAAEMMAVHALQALADDVDFSIYDTNGDGFIDNVYVFYAGLGENDGGSKFTVWPHSYDLDKVRPDEVYEFNGVRFNHYACSNELTSTRAYTGIGTFVHEFSHVLGLPDLYHTLGYSTVTPDTWSVLDHGPYNNDGRTPPNYSMYERHALGWTKPLELTADGDYTLRNLEDSNEGFIIQSEGGNEYYLFENRQKTGWDTYLPGHGMLVWHVDYDEEIWNMNTVNNENAHQRVDLVEADKIASPGTKGSDPFPGEKGITEFGPSKKPALKWWDGTEIPIYLTEITETDGLITFHLENRGGTGIETVSNATGITSGADYIASSCNYSCDVYDLTGRKAGTLPPSGTLSLNRGVYIVMTQSGAVKINVR